jgi:hypothetical protein
MLLLALALAAQAQQVVINGVAHPAPGMPAGRYWYDATSGLWGLEGGPSIGYTRPGESIGRLDPHASGGGTAVTLNGRILPPTDLQQLVMVFGEFPAGRYWLDAHGNLGRDGQPAFADLLPDVPARSSTASSGSQYSLDLNSSVQYDLDIGSGQFMDMNTGDIYSR